MKRNYNLLLVSQFLTAFGDNVLLAIIIGQLKLLLDQGAVTQAQNQSYNAFYTSCFFVPYVLLAPIAGFLNDRYAKSSWLMGGNLIKLCGVLVAASSVWTGFIWQAPGYFIVGIGACLYSPAKYGILPEILPMERLVKANGTVEVLTIVAILLGPVTGAILIDRFPVLTCYLILFVIYLTSLTANFFIIRTPENPSIKLHRSAGEFFAHVALLFRSKRLRNILLAGGIFWICGAVMKMNFQPWGSTVLKLPTNTQISLLGLWLGVGIIIGSVIAGQIHKIGDLRAIRVYGFALAALIFLLGLLLSKILIPIVLVAIGTAAGLFLVPLNAALQAEGPPESLGKTIATQNLVNNMAMILAGAYVALSVFLKLTPIHIFFGLAGITVLAIWGLRIPDKQRSQ